MARTAKTTNPPANTDNSTPPAIFGVPQTEMNQDQLDEIASEDNFDIFQDVGQRLTDNGDRIQYTIKRDGEFLAGAIRHPFSWDMIQRKYGAGSYQVLARSTKAKGYIKSESRHVAAPEETPEEFKDENMRPAQSSMTELLMLLQSTKKEEREEAREREERLDQQRREEAERREAREREKEKEMKENSNQTMMLMMEMMKQSSAQTTALLTGLLSGKKEDISIEKVLTLMDSRMEKMVDKITGGRGKGEMTVAEQVKMIADAEERGNKRAMDMIRIADKKAEELADLRENGGNKGTEDRPSMVRELMDAVVPLAQGFIASKAGAPAPTTPPGAINPHQRALPPPMGARKPANAAQMLGLNKTPGERKAPQSPPMTQKELIENTAVAVMAKDLSANMLTPQKLNPEAAADKVLELLVPHKITPSSLCSQYSLDDMIRGAKSRGVPDAVKPYLERFYAHIKGKANGNDSNQASVDAGKPTESSQPANS